MPVLVDWHFAERSGANVSCGQAGTPSHVPIKVAESLLVIFNDRLVRRIRQTERSLAG